VETEGTTESVIQVLGGCGLAMRARRTTVGLALG
jgi:hypothetical protein